MTSPYSGIISYPVECDGVRLRALEAGTGPRVIICLHGAGSRADRWAPNLPGLAQAGYHVYAIDFPGHGFADKHPGLDYSTPRFADLVAVFIDQVGAQPVTLFGTSLGGHVAATVAVRDPARISSVVLVGAVGLVGIDRDPAALNNQINDLSTEGIRRKLEFLVYDKSLVTDHWVAEEHRVNTSPGASAALSRVRAYLDGPISDDIIGARYADLRLPTMLVWGAQDRWVPPEVGHRTAELLGSAPLVLLEHAGHAPYFERPGTFNDIALSFLSDPASVKGTMTA